MPCSISIKPTYLTLTLTGLWLFCSCLLPEMSNPSLRSIEQVIGSVVTVLLGCAATLALLCLSRSVRRQNITGPSPAAAVWCGAGVSLVAGSLWWIPLHGTQSAWRSLAHFLIAMVGVFLLRFTARIWKVAIPSLSSAIFVAHGSWICGMASAVCLHLLIGLLQLVEILGQPQAIAASSWGDMFGYLWLGICVIAAFFLATLTLSSPIAAIMNQLAVPSPNCVRCGYPASPSWQKCPECGNETGAQ